MADQDRRFCVIQVVNSLAPAGAERLTTDLARSLDVDEFDVHVLVVRDGRLREYVEEAGLPLVQTGFEFDYTFPFVIARMARYIREKRPDIVHTHMLGSDIVGRIAALFAGTPIIVSTQHDTQRRRWIYRTYRRTTASLVDSTVACSEAVAEFCRTQIGAPDERIVTIENGIEVERYKAGRSEWREPVTFGAVGSLIPVKGHDTLIGAFSQIAEELPGSSLIIAGEGVERERLESQIARYGLAGRVSLLGRVDDVPELLSQIDVFVHPSSTEGQPLAVLEAMAASKPIIGSDIPALAETLDGGEAGRLVSPSDEGLLASAMVEVARNPQKARQMGQRARVRVEAQYSLDRTVGQYASLYRDLLEREGLVADDGRRVEEEPRKIRPGSRALQRGLQLGLFAIVAFFIWRSLRLGFQESGFVGLDFQWSFLVLSVSVLLAYYGLFVGGFWLLLRGLGEKPHFRDAFKLSFVSNVGKYLPGGIWPVASRMALAPRAGVRRHTMLVASALESAVSVTGGSLLFLIALLFGAQSPNQTPVWTALGVLVAAGIFLHPAVLRAVIGWSMRLLQIEGDVPYLSPLAAMGLVLYYSMTWIVGGFAFYIFARALFTDPGASPLAYAGYFAASAIVGLLILFAPGGIGAREGAMLLLLSGPLGPANAAVVALASRVWTSLTELLLSGCAVVLPYRHTEEPQSAEITVSPSEEEAAG